MLFKINKKELLNSLNIVSRAISNFSPLPAYSGIKFEVLEKEITLLASDSNISIQSRLTVDSGFYLEIIQTGSIVIESKYINDIIRKMDSDVIEIEVMDGCNIIIKDEFTKFNLIGMYASEYPDIAFDKNIDFFKINSTTFKDAITKIIFATSDKETRPFLNGVNFNINDNIVDCSATDSYRLAKSKFNINQSLFYNVIIPAKSLHELIKSLDGDFDFEVNISHKKVQFILDQTIIQTRLIDGIFPNVTKLIPTEFLYELDIDKRDLMSVLDRVSFIKNDGVNIIRLDLNEDTCILSTKSQEIGSAREILKSASFKGEPLSISFNGRYVLEALRTLDAGQVALKFSGDSTPFIILDEKNENLLHLSLPVRTYL